MTPRRIAAALLAFGFVLSPLGLAAEDRFVMKETDNGIIRMNTETGQVSHCTFEDEKLACRMADDDRDSYEEEIARLKEQMKTPGEGGKVGLPSDEDIDEAVTAFEKFAGAILEAMKRIQKDVEDLGEETEDTAE